MKVLSLNPHFDKIRLWQQRTTSITSLDRHWYRKPLPLQALSLLKRAVCFDVIVFYRNYRLSALFGLFKGITKIKPRLVLQDLYWDIDRDRPGFKSVVSNLRDAATFRVPEIRVWTLAHSMDAIIVYTSSEVEMYSDFFGVPKSRFKFVPYFFGDYPCGDTNRPGKQDYIVAAGRHRDFQCFIAALKGMPWKGVIVAGELDRDEVGKDLPVNIEAHYEVPREKFCAFIAHASIAVIPLHGNRHRRAMGQIAMLEAMGKRKPVVAARTFQLTDYVTDDEVLYYRPGNAEHLRNQIQRLVQDPVLRNRLADNAFTRIQTEFTLERHVRATLQVCKEVCT